MLLRVTRRWALRAFLIALWACHPTMEPSLTEKFKLSADVGTTPGNPVEVVAGALTSPGGGSMHVPAGYFLEGDWIGGGTAEMLGDDYHAAPDSLHLLWYSFAEDKFYQGDFSLPRARIYALLKAGYWDDAYKKQATYGEITLCMLPKGGVVVWLSGGNKVLLGRYQGHVVAHDFTSFKPGANRARMAQEERAKLPATIQQQLRTGSFSPRPWDAYLVKYPWRVEVLMEDTLHPAPLSLYSHYVEYFSAEDDSYPLTKEKEGLAPFLDIVRQPTPKAIPQVLGLFVENKYKEKHQIRINPFDEAETLAAFQKLAAAHPQEPIVLRVEVDKLYQNYRLTLSNAYQTLPLDKATVKVFEE